MKIKSLVKGDKSAQLNETVCFVFCHHIFSNVYMCKFNIKILKCGAWLFTLIFSSNFNRYQFQANDGMWDTGQSVFPFPREFIMDHLR